MVKHFLHNWFEMKLTHSSPVRADLLKDKAHNLDVYEWLDSILNEKDVESLDFLPVGLMFNRPNVSGTNLCADINW
jgi:hypothetical protein